MVVISGQVGNSLIGTDAFQEVDTVGITRPCVKHNFLVTDINELAETIKKAFQIAASGRPGPVVVDVPKDVTQAMAKFSYPQEDIFIRSYQPVVQGHIGQIKKAVQMLASAKRPVVYFGGGVVLGNASEELTRFVRMTGAPCTGTLMGLGAYPSGDRQFLGMLGMHGTYEANLAMQNADVVLAVGARFDDRVVSVPSKFFYFGGGVVLGNASEELTRFVRMTGAPCTGTLMGLGAYPSGDRQFLGMLGMHGTYEANLAMQNADVVLAVGARFDDRVVSVPSKFFEKAKKVIHIDVDPSSIAKRVKVDIPIVGDVKNVLSEMVALWQKQESVPSEDALGKWWKTIEEWRSRDCLWFDNGSEIIKPQYVIQKLAEITGNSAIITSDVGQHQMFAAQYYPFERPRQWLNSGGLGTMGVGLPYAIGAKLAAPDQDVFCITGDGSIQMNIQELSTCFQYRIPVNVITLNNGYLGMVRQWQEIYYGGRESETYFDSLPDFVKLAEAYGHIGIRVDKKSDVEGALLEALNQKDRLVFIDFLTDQKQNVMPMVGNGKGLDEMVLPPHMRADGKA